MKTLYSFLDSQAHLIAATAIFFALSLAIIVNVVNYHEKSPIKWDGARYNLIFEAYETNGHSFNHLLNPTLNGDVCSEVLKERILYYWTLTLTKKITSFDNLRTYYTISLIFFFLTSCVVFCLMYNVYKLGFLPSLIAGAWCQINPSVYIVYEVGAHPEAMHMFFSAFFFYFYKKDKWIPMCICLLLAILLKFTIMFLVLFACIEVFISRNDQNWESLVISWAKLILPVLFGIMLIKMIVSVNSEGFFALTGELSIANNQRALKNILFNFDVVTIPFLMAVLMSDRNTKLIFALMSAAGLLIMTIHAIDWFRVIFSMYFIIVIPMAVKFIEDYFSQDKTVRYMFYILISVLLLRLPARLDFEFISKFEYWPYAIVLAFLLLYRRVLDPQKTIKL